MPTLRSRLERTLSSIDESASMFQEAPAWWVNGKELLHFVDDRTLDLRLTRALIGQRRAELKQDPRVTLRRSGAAWLTVTMASARDLPFVEALVRDAVQAHLPLDGSPPRPPPVGADLERQRRFH